MMEKTKPSEREVLVYRGSVEGKVVFFRYSLDPEFTM